jgi:tetratricopeptide (TPR) repeat protein
LNKIKITYIAIGVLILFFGSCSTKRDTIVSRTLHSTAAKYNILYNGNLAFDKAKKEIDDAYQDDFSKVLPIEPLKIKENDVLPIPLKPSSKLSVKANTKPNAQGFQRAEEKAVKAIQKHSMNIGTKERNKQIDDAYFLLGKSRYYDQRFIPALETFKYMIKKYPKSDLFQTARVWEAKTLIRLGQEEDAIYKLDKYLTKNKDLENQIKDDAHTALAMAYSKMDSTQQVINHLNESLKFTNKNYNQATRNAFILGQLYRNQNKIDSSNLAFEKIANNKKAPYRFKIYAQIERAKNYNKETDNTSEILEKLQKLTKNRDNRPYLDAIFYQIGKIKLTNQNTEEAIKYFKKSLRTKLVKDVQKDLAYEALGNIYFDKAEFITSGAYYDSVINLSLLPKSRRFRKIKRIRKSIDYVIKLENERNQNDSILNLVAMNAAEREAFFKEYIKKLKQKDKEAAIIAKNLKGNNFSGFGNLNSNTNSKKGSKFYFYNPQTVSFGQQEFKKIWGNRPLENNWRLSDKTSPNESDTKTEKNEIQEEKSNSKKYELATYLDKIPNDKTKIDSIIQKRNKAYYNLGVLYKEQFKKPELAVNRLESLINFDIQKTNFELPTYYHLYQAYKQLDNTSKSNYYKDKIVSEYPESKYAKLILNPDTKEENEIVNSPKNKYKEVFKKYKNNEFEQVIKDCNNHLSKLDESPIKAKFELLKAHAIAKTKGKEAFIKSLTFIVNNYPNTEESRRAQEIINFLTGVKEQSKKKEKKKLKNKTEKENIKRKGKLPSKEEMLKKIKKRKSIGPPNSKIQKK